MLKFIGSKVELIIKLIMIFCLFLLLDRLDKQQSLQTAALMISIAWFVLDINAEFKRQVRNMELRIKLKLSGEDEYIEEIRKAYEAGRRDNGKQTEKYIRDFKNRIYKI